MRIQILACGTSRCPALVGAYLLEQLPAFPPAVFHAGEFRYAPLPDGPPAPTRNGGKGPPSQENADTLAALLMDA